MLKSVEITLKTMGDAAKTAESDIEQVQNDRFSAPELTVNGCKSRRINPEISLIPFRRAGLVLMFAAFFAHAHALPAADDEGGYDEGSMYRNLEERECPILDTPFSRMSALEVFYTLPAKSTATAWDDIAAAEIDAWLRFLYLENEMGGDLEMLVHWNSLILQNFDGVDSWYPLATAAIPIRWSQRFEYGWGMQLEIEPGLYSTLKSFELKDFNVPAGLNVIHAFTPNFALFAGARVYPGFKMPVVPRGGLHLSSGDVALVEIAYPESRLEFMPFRGLRFHVSGGILNWPEFNMGDDERERIMYDDLHVRGGFDVGITDSIELTFQGGYVFERTLSFKGEGADVDIEDAPLFGLGIRGRL